MIELDEQQRAALDLLNEGKSAFLTGSAGTGKSTVTTAFMGASMRKVDVAATTGIAAINLRDQFAAKAGKAVNVMTIYRWLGIGLGPAEGQSHSAFWDWWRGSWSNAKANACRRLERAECLIIDEISMLPGRLLTYMDWHLKQIRGNNDPLGGLQLVAVGDFLQLPPVDKSGLGHDWAFQSPAWEEGITPIMLHKVHRQADPVFAGLLNEFRVGRLSLAGVRVVAGRVSPFCDAKIPRLFTHNAAVDKWNNAMLSGLPGEAVTYMAAVSGDNEDQRKWLIKNLITPFALVLKVGAQVMVTANLCLRGELLASNGTLATVLSLSDEAVEVLTDEGATLELRKNCWQFDQQDDNSARFYQIPLRLAWASTIHKSQGLTLKEAWIDIRSAREPGQAYVALSRVKSLSGLHLKAVPGGIFTAPAAVAFYDKISRATPAPKQQAEPAYLY